MISILYILICIGLTVGYIYYIGFCLHWWRISYAEPHPSVSISVIVVARNEEDNIGRCLKAIAANRNESTNVEIILVDDHSTDRTVDIAQGLGIDDLTILALSDFDQLEHYGAAYKKAAIHYALSHTENAIVMTTDADCWMPSRWVSRTSQQLQSGQYRAMSGLVMITGGDGILSAFQSVEMLGTMAGTNAGIRSGLYQSANAANMIFYKEDYLQYLKESSHKNASGDDVFFVQWLVDNGGRLGFNSELHCVVTTPAESTLSQLWAQRTRWATKTTQYNSIGTKVLMGALFIFHVSIIANLLIGIVLHQFLAMAAVQLVIKLIIDALLLHRVSEDYGYPLPWRIYVPLALLHTLYITMMGIIGLTVKNYTWKGRRVQ